MQLLRFNTICLTIVLACAGCTKNESTTAALHGKWELRREISGQTAQTTEFPAGNGTYLIFTDGRFSRYAGNRLVGSGEYKIYPYQATIIDETGYKISFNNEPLSDSPIYYKLSGDQLIITADAYDAGASIYFRITDSY